MMTSWKTGLAALALLALTAAPAMAAEQAVVVKPSDTDTVRICFRLAAIAWMGSELDASAAAEDRAAGREPTPVFLRGEQREDGMPSYRAVFLGWGKALAADQAARGLTGEAAALDAAAAAKANASIPIWDRSGEFDDQKARCRDLLAISRVDGRPVAEMTTALDPADMTDHRFSPDSPMIDDETLLMCMARADTARTSIGAAVLGDEARFHRLLRERHPDTYEQTVAGALQASMTKVGKHIPEPGTAFEAKAMVSRFKAAQAEDAALCNKYR